MVTVKVNIHMHSNQHRLLLKHYLFISVLSYLFSRLLDYLVGMIIDINNDDITLPAQGKNKKTKL